MRNLTIAIALTLLFQGAAYAGDINQSQGPDEAGTKMWTLNQIYTKVYNGAPNPATKHTGTFVGPTAGPGSTMYTLDNIYDAFTADATACAGTLASDVLAGKTFFATSGTTRAVAGVGTWGPVVGTANTPPGSGTAAVAGQVLNGYYSFNAAGSALSGSANTPPGTGTAAAAGQILSTYYAFNAAGTAIPGSYTPPASFVGLPKTTQTSAANGHPAVPPNDFGDDQAVSAGYPGNGVAETIARWTLNPNADPTNITVKDNATGLTWMRRGDMPTAANEAESGGAVYAATINWTDAFTYIATLNAASYGGYNDWRMPNIKELQSIVNYQVWSPAIYRDALGYFTGSASYYYWSSTTRASGTANAWIMNFDSGAVGSNSKTVTYYVRPVRGS